MTRYLRLTIDKLVKVYPLSTNIKDIVEKEVKEMIGTKVTERLISAHHAPVQVTRQNQYILYRLQET